MKRNEIKKMEWPVAAILITAMIVVFGCNIFHYNYKMNSDIGAEAVLGRLIWDSKEIIPASWYPSTETRIIATPLPVHDKNFTEFQRTSFLRDRLSSKSNRSGCDRLRSTFHGTCLLHDDNRYCISYMAFHEESRQ